MKEKISKIKESKLVKKHAEKIRFVLVGGFNTILDFIIFGTCANVIGIDKVISNIISTSICVVISFVLNYKFVWKSEKSMKATIAGFLTVTLFSAWVVQSIVITGVTAIIGESSLAKLFAKACGSGTGMITNYFGYKFVFKKQPAEKTVKQAPEKLAHKPKTSSKK